MMNLNFRNDKLAARLFGQERPHLFSVGTVTALRRCLAEKDHLVRLGFGGIHLHEPLYKDGPKPLSQRRGYEYRNEAEVNDLGRELARTFHMIGYLHGPNWVKAGLTIEDAIDMTYRYEWQDGMYGDHFGMRTREETLDLVQRLRIRFPTGWLVQHCTLEPHCGHTNRPPVRGPWNDLLDHVIIREKQLFPGNPTPPISAAIQREWQNWVSTARWTGAISNPKLWKLPIETEPITPEMAATLTALPSWGCSFRCHWGAKISVFVQHFFPAWAQLRAEWIKEHPSVLPSPRRFG